MTKDEFEQGYAERSGLTVQELHEMGRYAVPCNCGYEGCSGWAMGHFTAQSITRYTCPHCGCFSADMRVSDQRLAPPADLAIPPDFAGVADQVLICKCGEPLTWLDLTPVLVQAPPGQWIGITPEEAKRRELYEEPERVLRSLVGSGWKIEPSESARPAIVGWGMVFNLERLPDPDPTFEEVIAKIMATGCPGEVRLEPKCETGEFKDCFSPINELVAALRQRLAELWPDDEITVEPDAMGGCVIVMMRFMLQGQECGLRYRTPSFRGNATRELVEYAVSEIRAERNKLEARLR